MKLKESIPSNSVKIIDLYNKIDSDTLDTSPNFQRKLVWKKQHKYSFIDTILMNYPFPEVYIASSEMDVENLKSKEIVVDGKQRLTAIVEYIKGINDFENQQKIKPFTNLTIDEKREFLNYLVTVKDLKDIGISKIKEIFQRINSTEYSLNANERLNAQYGDGEFAVFCKQIVDNNYNVTIDDTDVVLNLVEKTELNIFFVENEIFNDNDKSRMFDVQYIMLIVSTFLEGEYFGRSSKVNDYLEKYNSTFDLYETSLTLLLNSIRIVGKLKFSKRSYWYNKANLFTLIVELSKIRLEDIDISKLEFQLLELETKVDLYFSDDESVNITEEEKKYFEVARQGSHEKAARIHRGIVIKKIIADSMPVKDLIEADNIENKNVELLKLNTLSYSVLIPTETGLNKGIIDAVYGVREFLKLNSFHDYEIQEFGPNHKVSIIGEFILRESVKETRISLYRANGRGDYRISFSDLNSFVSPYDKIALINKNGILNILNISKYDYTETLKIEKKL